MAVGWASARVKLGALQNQWLTFYGKLPASHLTRHYRLAARGLDQKPLEQKPLEQEPKSRGAENG